MGYRAQFNQFCKQIKCMQTHGSNARCWTHPEHLHSRVRSWYKCWHAKCFLFVGPVCRIGLHLATLSGFQDLYAHIMQLWTSCTFVQLQVAGLKMTTNLNQHLPAMTKTLYTLCYLLSGPPNRWMMTIWNEVHQNVSSCREMSEKLILSW